MMFVIRTLHYLATASQTFDPNNSQDSAGSSRGNKKSSQDNDTVTKWHIDTAVLYRCVTSQDRKDISITLLFDDFCRNCSFPGSTTDQESSSSSLSTSLTNRKKRKTCNDNKKTTESNNNNNAVNKNDLVDEEIKNLQCRFLLSLNDLQRLGCLRIMSSGDQVKRLLA